MCKNKFLQFSLQNAIMSITTTATHYVAVEKTWHGPNRKDLYAAEANLSGEIIKALKQYPDKVIQLMEPNGTEITAAKIIRDSELIAKEFLKLGLKTDDVVGVYASNTNNLTAVILGSLLCGTPWNPIYAEFDKTAVKEVFELTTPKIICCDVENYEILKKALNEMNLQAIVYTVNGKISNVASIEDILSGFKENTGETSFPGLHINPDATAAILCSSGTTGRPKGVLVSHRPLLNNNSFRDLNADSVLFCFSPLYWISGVWTQLASLLNCAKRIITNLPSTPKNLLNIIEKHNVTHVMASTTLITQLVQEVKTVEEKRLSSLHCLLVGGAKVPDHIGERLYELFQLTETKPGPLICYGLTELAGMLTQTHTYTTNKRRRYDVVGKLRPNMAARIAIDQEACSFLGPNEKGFIIVRLPYKWSGYYRNSVATEKVYKNGWLNTGDVGYFDDEGHLIICARESDIFKSYGFQVFPNQLEELIMQMPGVVEACIFGVPDLVATNLIACAVVRSKNADGEGLTASQVEHYVKENVAKTFQLTGGVYFLESLPRNVNGKLLRRKVFDLIQNTKV